MCLSDAMVTEEREARNQFNSLPKKNCLHKVQPHADESSSYFQYLLVGNSVFNANKTWRVGKFPGLGAHGGRLWYLEKWMT
ncbi:hypothetical protein DKX38_020276 [Salix brachista]|uniref:Uncharacterized protein n=1 Tax=Salix brachista TaxID=2182728 RepID=A0A5N5KIL9_9ROSI|nr:hypothetical protein DKX38_020276 [Salix brachista]